MMKSHILFQDTLVNIKRGKKNMLGYKDGQKQVKMDSGLGLPQVNVDGKAVDSFWI